MSPARSPVSPNALIVNHARGLCATTKAAYDATSANGARAPRAPEHAVDDHHVERHAVETARDESREVGSTLARDDSLPAVEHDGQQARAVPVGPDAWPSPPVHARRIDQCDHLGAERPEQARRRRARDAIAELEHPHPREEVAATRVGHGAVASGTWASS